jgi:hypothetical protein
LEELESGAHALAHQLHHLLLHRIHALQLLFLPVFRFSSFFLLLLLLSLRASNANANANAAADNVVDAPHLFHPQIYPCFFFAPQ